MNRRSEKGEVIIGFLLVLSIIITAGLSAFYYTLYLRNLTIVEMLSYETSLACRRQCGAILNNPGISQTCIDDLYSQISPAFGDSLGISFDVILTLYDRKDRIAVAQDVASGNVSRIDGSVVSYINSLLADPARKNVCVVEG